MARLRDKYKNEIAPALAKEFGIENPMAIPKVEKIVVNMGVGEAIGNAKILDAAVEELRSITGQKPVITKAKKSSAAPKSTHFPNTAPFGSRHQRRGHR